MFFFCDLLVLAMKLAGLFVLTQVQLAAASEFVWPGLNKQG